MERTRRARSSRALRLRPTRDERKSLQSPLPVDAALAHVEECLATACQIAPAWSRHIESSFACSALARRKLRRRTARCARDRDQAELHSNDVDFGRSTSFAG